jgi:hypothetical protein
MTSLGSDISQLGTTIASKILSALTLEPEATEPVPTIPLDEQKKYLKRYVDGLNIADKKAIGDILIMNQRRSCLNFCNEGTIINLDTLPPFIITQMYDLMVYKINRKNQSNSAN